MPHPELHIKHGHNIYTSVSAGTSGGLEEVRFYFSGLVYPLTSPQLVSRGNFTEKFPSKICSFSGYVFNSFSGYKSWCWQAFIL